MRILLVLLAVVLVGIVGFNVNGCTSDDAQPELQQVQDTTAGAADTTDTVGAADTTDTTDTDAVNTTGAADTTDTVGTTDTTTEE
tara:strand:- start:153 stop:407 length:255 start_codon:yes stop_codon:yes gene_type:complete